MAEHAPQPPVAATQVEDDAVSVTPESLASSKASLRSSIMEFRAENGRTYHRLSDGKYFGPNDETEQDRLDHAHELWLRTWDSLCNSPKKYGANRVLDVGTGTGIWSIDYADEHPEATVIGVDLSPIQPEFVPPNCYFEVDDIDKPWIFSQPFDFIFVRAMVGSFRSWPKFLSQAYDNLEPGGYIELHDNNFPAICGDGTMTEDSYILQWTQNVVKATDVAGQPITTAPSFKRLLEEAGFVDVQERTEYWPVGTWAADPRQKNIGLWCAESMMQGIESICMALFTRMLDWTKEEVLVFCAHVRDEMKKGKVHAYFLVYSVWGRKPEKEASEPPEA
ncbi:Secondary metabolism regulator laeA [Colletotrichum gloeosporioides]|uniref:Secondary metabolism regulator laeA n=1 Tax=Colletotrichum gloeosporioides TaxID=474922 RepID=A0A8H4C939_COLGL|nr:Secondary metabolism regulator laeA [Colletotrichum gloeosporioides]KAF3799463.1 Secondary metabolism regulator laeA [Colletotrichum gloeosporioides]